MVAEDVACRLVDADLRPPPGDGETALDATDSADFVGDPERRQSPQFPAPRDFLDHWRRERERPSHAVRLARQRLVQPAEWRVVDGVVVVR
jgi:hypothetical protein